MLESVAKEAPDAVEVHVQLATAYNRLKRKDDADRERAIVDRLNAEAAAKQKGGIADEGAGRSLAVVAPRVATVGRRRAARQPHAEAGDAEARARPQKPRTRNRRGAAAPSPEFEKLLKAATEARQAERWEEAIGLYAKVVKLKPDYVEGLLVSGHGVLHARRLPALPGDRSARW